MSNWEGGNDIHDSSQMSYKAPENQKEYLEEPKSFNTLTASESRRRNPGAAPVSNSMYLKTSSINYNEPHNAQMASAFDSFRAYDQNHDQLSSRRGTAEFS